MKRIAWIRRSRWCVALLLAGGSAMFLASARADDPNPAKITNAEGVVSDQAPGASRTPAATQDQQTEGPATNATQTPQPSTDSRTRSGSAHPEARNLGLRLKSNKDGLWVDNVMPRSAAAQIGLRAGDQIVSLGGQAVTTQDQFQSQLENQIAQSMRERGTTIPVVVHRAGADEALSWTNAALAMAGYGPLANGYAATRRAGSYAPSATEYRAGYRGEGAGANPNGAFLGIELDQRYLDRALVTNVLPGSAADHAGLKSGDTIWGLNGEHISSYQELAARISQMQPGQRVTIDYHRPMKVEVVLGQHGASQGNNNEPQNGQNRPQPSPDDNVNQPSGSTQQTETSAQQGEKPAIPADASEKIENSNR